jgi:hypothetical protein
MNYESSIRPRSTAKAKKARLSMEDIREIENDIMAEPTAYPVMVGTNGLRKMRFAPNSMSTGKSGGIRVCYFVIDAAARSWLVTMFAKNEKDNLSNDEKQGIARMIAAAKAAFRHQASLERP